MILTWWIVVKTIKLQSINDDLHKQPDLQLRKTVWRKHENWLEHMRMAPLKDVLSTKIDCWAENIKISSNLASHQDFPKEITKKFANKNTHYCHWLIPTL